MGTTYHTKPIVTDGLVFCVDPANKVSWSGPDSSNVNDLIGTNTGTIVNDTSGSYGDNFSFAFDGTDDRIQTNNFTGGLSALSVSGWFNPDGNGLGGAGGIISNDDVTRSWYVGWYSVPDNSVRWFVSTNGSSSDKKNSLSLRSFNSFPNEWYHFVCTWENEGQLKIYINGTLNGTPVNVSNTSGGTLNISNSTDIGKRVTTYFDGKIGPLYVYNRVLSASEVAQNYNALKNRFI